MQLLALGRDEYLRKRGEDNGQAVHPVRGVAVVGKQYIARGKLMDETLRDYISASLARIEPPPRP